MENKRYILLDVLGEKHIFDSRVTTEPFPSYYKYIVKSADNMFDLLELGDRYEVDSGFIVEVSCEEHLKLDGVLAFTGIKKIYKRQPNGTFREFIITKESNKPGFCPICDSAVEYCHDGSTIVTLGNKDTCASYLWSCKKCGTTVVELYDLKFSKQFIIHKGGK
jgi:hypothetical protein